MEKTVADGRPASVPEPEAISNSPGTLGCDIMSDANPKENSDGDDITSDAIAKENVGAENEEDYAQDTNDTVWETMSWTTLINRIPNPLNPMETILLILTN